jgi:hypothetical protein
MKNGKKMLLVSLAACFCAAGAVVGHAAYQGVAIVAKSGGQFTDPVAALNAVGGLSPLHPSWCSKPSASRPCLVKILPGVYDVGTNVLKMRPYVDVEGAGENTTIVTGVGGSSTAEPSTGVVRGASNAELRFLTVKAVSNAAQEHGHVVAVYNDQAATKLTHMTVQATGTSSNGKIAGIYNTNAAAPVLTSLTITASGSGFGDDFVGMYNANSSPVVSDVTISVTGNGMSTNYGVYNDGANPQMRNITASVTGGTSGGNYGYYNTNSSPVMENMRVHATGAMFNYGIYNDNASAPTMKNITVEVQHGDACIGITNDNSSPVMMNVNVTANHAAYETTGIYNDTSAPVMTNVNAAAFCLNGMGADGIYNTSSAPVMTNVNATAADGADNTGIRNHNSSPRMNTVFASASNGIYNDGLYNEDSSPVLTHVTAIAKNGSHVNNGMSNYASSGSSSTVTVDGSTFEGNTSSIDNASGVTLKIGASKLIGPATTDGIYRCVGAYSDAYLPLNATCQ